MKKRVLETFDEITEAFFKKFPEYQKLDFFKQFQEQKKQRGIKEPSADELFLNFKKNANDYQILDVLTRVKQFVDTDDTHMVAVAFAGDYMMIADKGIRPDGKKQIEAYKINRQAAGDNNFFSTLTSKTSLTLLDTLYRVLPKLLEGKKDSICHSLSNLINSEQIVGNCFWESHETALAGIVALEQLLKPGHKKLALDKADKIMDDWRLFSWEYLLNKYEMLHKQHPQIEMDEMLFGLAKRQLEGCSNEIKREGGLFHDHKREKAARCAKYTLTKNNRKAKKALLLRVTASK